MKKEAAPLDISILWREIPDGKTEKENIRKFSSHHGGEIFSRIHSYISTVYKQGQPIRAAIQQAMIGTPVSFALSVG